MSTGSETRKDQLPIQVPALTKHPPDQDARLGEHSSDRPCDARGLADVPGPSRPYEVVKNSKARLGQIGQNTQTHFGRVYTSSCHGRTIPNPTDKTSDLGARGCFNRYL